jgi:tetratricopeptide (TPR) repeat protein
VTRSPLIGKLAPWIAIATAALVPHLHALRCGFVFDDVGVIVENPAITGFDLGKIWTEPYWPQNPGAHLYRPLVSTGYAIDWALAGGKPWLFHLRNLLIHAATALAALALLRSLFPARPGLAFAAAALFALHPLHVEAVAGIVGRAESLAALLTLGSALAWLRAEHRPGARPLARLLPAALWMLALLAKESALGLPALLLAHRLGWLSPASGERRLRRPDLAWPAALALVLLLRISALGGLAAPEAARVDNPLAHVDSIHRVLGAGGVLARQAGQVLTLLPLSPDYSFAEVVPEGGLLVAGGIALAALLAASVASVRRRRSPAGWGFFFFLCFWLITSNLVVPLGTVQADRLLYLPLLGLLVAACAAFPRRPRGALAHAGSVLLLLALARCWIVSARTTGHWTDDATLFRAAVEAAPRSVKARSNLAVSLLRSETPAAARATLEVIAPVAGVAPEYGPLLQREAKARMFLGERERARALFRESLRLGADSAEVWIELGNLALMDEDGAAALAAFDAAAKTGKRTANVAIGHASALALSGRYGEAANAWLPIVASLPDSVPVRVACAWNLREAGRLAEAGELLRHGLARRRDQRLLAALAGIDSLRSASPR